MTSVDSAPAPRPSYVYDLKALKTLTPIMYPTAILNVALNYVEHSREMAGLKTKRLSYLEQSLNQLWFFVQAGSSRRRTVPKALDMGVSSARESAGSDNQP